MSIRMRAAAAAMLTALVAAATAAPPHRAGAGPAQPADPSLAADADPPQAPPDPGAADERAGGATTAYATGRNAFSFPFATLDDAERSRFALGNSFFRRNWVEAPSSTSARDGLGPHFIARSCGGCHLQDGRGAPPGAVKRHAGAGDGPEPAVALLLRLSVPGAGPHAAPLPEPRYGDQFNNAAVQGVRPEGRVTIRHRARLGRFKDGTRYVLLQPQYGFADLAYGPMAPDVQVSPRVAPHLAGVGLLEAIPEHEILRNAEQQALRTDGIRGQPNRVWDAVTSSERIGRFGWKANVATLAHQTAGAFLGDMGITTEWFPQEPCTPVQPDCLSAPRGGAQGGPELDSATLGHVVFYQAALAPAARRNRDDPRVRAGERLFERARCDACHRPGYVTGVPPLPQLSPASAAGQRIWPYTDLLLHDMGPDLADGRPDFRASGRQWKTPPLWGIGLFRDVNGHTRLLHDGRARGVLEAILWHGGEAEASRRRVLEMTRAERDALVRFVESL